MAAMDHYSRNTVGGIIALLAERAIVLIQQLVDELVDFFAEGIRWIFSLLEEESGWVL